MGWLDPVDYPAPHFESEEAAEAWWDAQGIEPPVEEEDDDGDGSAA